MKLTESQRALLNTLWEAFKRNDIEAAEREILKHSANSVRSSNVVKGGGVHAVHPKPHRVLSRRLPSG
jgi:hypothetical protein